MANNKDEEFRRSIAEVVNEVLDSRKAREEEDKDPEKRGRRLIREEVQGALRELLEDRGDQDTPHVRRRTRRQEPSILQGIFGDATGTDDE